ncbi:biotin--[acetyl-CoA-carboxylase] ligase [Nicoliella spurrieriana]|uniref:Bifunctional ligase/repressor BirA n=1 Tax=Nicoliella spurrieriana TaxID=2925830 RepID=A0A976RSW2_9LACO|nr:biotin--[acetyl-CoA-carboxylase] ligase [Nicoliella spurrieriana]UQS87191.1 biotin--[acetyl-CoA-carboxylase] ligase [Nicoliella spurrieriana]
MSNSQILKIFLNHPNQWLSGTAIAKQLSISRTMVWKTINILIDNGHQIERKHNLGYRYLGTTQLSATKISLQCSQSIQIKTFDQIDSTNKYAKDILNHKQITNPFVIIANQQTAGYGRRGRHFYSPANSGLYLTIAVPVEHHAMINPGLLTTTTAVAVVRALKVSYPQIPFQLKWINDIWVNGQKVGGIMTESIMDVELMQPSAIIVGIGINLSTKQFPSTINQPVTSISANPIDRNQLAADIINQFMQSYPTYQSGIAMDEYRKLSVVIGKQVTINIRNQPIVGTVEAIDDNGALMLRSADGQLQRVMTGEVTKVRINHQNEK